MSSKKKKRRGNGAHAKPGKGLPHNLTRYLGIAAAIATILAAVIFILKSLGTDAKVENNNTCINSKCTFTNNK